ncbi:hypothetical protein [Adlercreutzia sp. ZJ154]|uniref:hypothetical protein n=1 Tax=Adlercreutzia sp. ZJ154 TaxID=2709790 RepID=UPI0013EA7CDE|nr:hypothetical protein [Adlercreutzia sp. ZJ154]
MYCAECKQLLQQECSQCPSCGSTHFIASLESNIASTTYVAPTKPCPKCGNKNSIWKSVCPECKTKLAPYNAISSHGTFVLIACLLGIITTSFFAWIRIPALSDLNYIVSSLSENNLQVSFTVFQFYSTFFSTDNLFSNLIQSRDLAFGFVGIATLLAYIAIIIIVLGLIIILMKLYSKTLTIEDTRIANVGFVLVAIDVALWFSLVLLLNWQSGITVLEIAIPAYLAFAVSLGGIVMIIMEKRRINRAFY